MKKSTSKWLGLAIGATLVVGVWLTSQGSVNEINGLEPRLEKNDLLTCIQIQRVLQTTKDALAMEAEMNNEGSDGQVSFTFDQEQLRFISLTEMSPKVRAALEVTRDNYEVLERESKTLNESQAEFESMLREISPILSTACEHVSSTR